MTNRGVLFWLSVLAYIGQNQYFGWNMKPMSHAELWWDNFVINLFIFSLFVRRITVRRRSE